MNLDHLDIKYFTSDPHFWHNNIIKYCNRPYASNDEMNHALIANWNEVVNDEDAILCLGDFSLNLGAVPSIGPRLHGKKFLIPGNHDHCHEVHNKGKGTRFQERTQVYIDAGFTILPLQCSMTINTQIVNLCHIPYGDIRYPKYTPEDNGKWLLHGHCHTAWKVKDKMINVGVDQWDMKPIHRSVIEAIIS